MPEREDRKPTNVETGRETTGAQIVGVTGQRWISTPLPASFTTYRTIRKQPTISLTRALVAAPILAGSWAVEADDEVKEDARGQEIQHFIRRQFTPHRERVMESAVNGGIDFGAQPFEIVYTRADGMLGIGKFKPLLQDLTTIMVDTSTGAFEGYKQTTTGRTVEIDKRYAMHVAFRVEGTQWWGQSLLENARETYNQWTEANQGAERYDAKVAGAHFVVHYPVGQTLYEGALTDNGEIAENLLEALASSGSLCVPNTQAAHVEELSNEDPAWKIEILEDKSARQPTFVDRLKYLDTLMVRSILMPERAITEGQFGTKAEAGVHADLAVTMVQLWDRLITDAVNRQPVDEVLEQNWGTEMRGKVRLVSSPLTDAQIAFLQDSYKALLTNPLTLLEEYETMDTTGLKDRLGIPKREEDAEITDEEQPGDGLTLEERVQMSRRTSALAE